jgi:Protein of unknown function (DUF3311)
LPFQLARHYPTNRFLPVGISLELKGKTMSGHSDEHKPVRPVHWARLLLLIPFVAMLWVSSYNSAEPMIAGIPFFYWYQLLWILIGAAIIGFVYALER